MIPKRKKRVRSGIRDDDGPIRCPGHLKWVRGHECCIAGKSADSGFSFRAVPLIFNHICEGRIEAHHVREGDHGQGMGRKPDDSTAVPLCSSAHKRGHDIGWETFEKEWRVDLAKTAAELWRISPHRITWERKRAGNE